MTTWYSDERRIVAWHQERRYAVLYRWKLMADQRQPEFEAVLVIPTPPAADAPAVIADARKRAAQYAPR